MFHGIHKAVRVIVMTDKVNWSVHFASHFHLLSIYYIILISALKGCMHEHTYVTWL